MTTMHLTDGPASLDVRLTPPDGWSERTLDEASAAVVAPSIPERFTPNLVVTLVSLPADADPTAAVLAVQDARNELPEVATLGEGTFEIRGRSWFITEYAYRDERAGTVAQSVRLWVGEAGEALRLTATLGASDVAERLDVVREVMDTVDW